MFSSPYVLNFQSTCCSGRSLCAVTRVRAEQEPPVTLTCERRNRKLLVAASHSTSCRRLCERHQCKERATFPKIELLRPSDLAGSFSEKLSHPRNVAGSLHLVTHIYKLSNRGERPWALKTGESWVPRSDRVRTGDGQFHGFYRPLWARKCFMIATQPSSTLKSVQRLSEFEWPFIVRLRGPVPRPGSASERTDPERTGMGFLAAMDEGAIKTASDGCTFFRTGPARNTPRRCSLCQYKMKPHPRYTRLGKVLMPRTAALEVISVLRLRESPRRNRTDAQRLSYQCSNRRQKSVVQARCKLQASRDYRGRII
jgi:hypothetical protein